MGPLYRGASHSKSSVVATAEHVAGTMTAMLIRDTIRRPAEILTMRVCETCSRSFVDGAPPDCPDPACPYADGLAVLEGEDKTLIDPEFDREKVLAMMEHADAEGNLPGTEALTRLDQRQFDATREYDEDSEDLSDLVTALLEERDADDDDIDSDPTEMRANTVSEPQPSDETTTERAVDVEGPTTLVENDEDDAESPTARLDAVGDDVPLDSIEISESADDAPNTEGPATAKIGPVDFALPLQRPDNEPTDLKPTLSIADLRASLKKRRADDSDGIGTLDEPTEGNLDQTAEEDGTYEQDNTTQMDAPEGSDFHSPGSRTSEGGRLEGSEDLLDFTDELLDGPQTTEFSKSAVRRAEALGPSEQVLDDLDSGPATLPPQVHPPQVYDRPPLQIPPPGGQLTQPTPQPPLPQPPSQPQLQPQPPVAYPMPTEQPQQPNLVPYEQQFLEERKPGLRLETWFVIAVIVLAVVGAVLAVANYVLR